MSFIDYLHTLPKQDRGHVGRKVPRKEMDRLIASFSPFKASSGSSGPTGFQGSALLLSGLWDSSVAQQMLGTANLSLGDF